MGGGSCACLIEDKNDNWIVGLLYCNNHCDNSLYRSVVSLGLNCVGR